MICFDKNKIEWVFFCNILGETKKKKKSVPRRHGIIISLCFLWSVRRPAVNDLIIGISRPDAKGVKMTGNETRVKDEWTGDDGGRGGEGKTLTTRLLRMELSVWGARQKGEKETLIANYTQFFNVICFLYLTKTNIKQKKKVEHRYIWRLRQTSCE